MAKDINLVCVQCMSFQRVRVHKSGEWLDVRGERVYREDVEIVTMTCGHDIYAYGYIPASETDIDYADLDGGGI